MCHVTWWPASVKFEEVIEKHQARITKDKRSVMSKVYMDTQPGNYLSTKGSEVVLACLHLSDPGIAVTLLSRLSSVTTLT